MVNFVFGDFELDATCFELRHVGEPVPIQPKVLRTLLYLVRHRARVVASEELLAAVWPHEVVTRGSIKRAVRSIRRALGETVEGAESASSIRTVRGHGYQFAVEVQERAEPTTRLSATAADVGAEGVMIEREVLYLALAGSWSDGERGIGHVLLLSGPAGVGKSRALEVLAEHARQRSGMAWCSRAPDTEGAPPYWPFIVMLREALQRPEGPMLRELMGDGAADLAQALPDLQQLIAVDAIAPSIDAAAARFRFFDSMLHFLRRVADRQPLLIAIDDLTLSDPPSIQLFSFLARHAPGTRVVLAASIRQGGGDAQSFPFASDARWLDVRGFSAAEVARFVEAHLGEPARPSLVEQLTESTAGNPLLLTHLLRLARAEHTGGAPVWDALTKLGVRHGLASAIERHLCELGDDGRDCLRTAALLGQSISVELLGQVLSASPARVAECLTEAQAQGLIKLVEADQGGRRLSFTHGLVRDALALEVESDSRLRIHARAAELIMRRGTAETLYAAEVAHHLAEAQRPEEALRFALLAADAALDQLAADAALVHYDRALHLLGQLPPRGKLRARILLDKGRAHAQGGDLGSARCVLFEAVALARTLGDHTLLAQAALSIAAPFEAVLDHECVELLREALRLDSTQELRALLLAALAKALCHSRDLWSRIEVAQQAIAAARSLEPSSQARARALGHCHQALSEPEHATLRHELCDELEAIGRVSGDHEILLRAATARIQDAVDLGDMQTVESSLGLLERMAERVREPVFRWYAQVYRAMQAMLEGRLEQALELAAGAERGGAAVGETTARHAYLIQAHGCLRLLGEYERAAALVYEAAAQHPTFFGWRTATAIAEFQRGRRDAARSIFNTLMAEDFLAAVRRDAFMLSALCPLAALCSVVGDPASADRIAEALTPYAGLCGTIGFGLSSHGPVAHYLGLLAVRKRDFARAQQEFERALQLAERMRSPTFVSMIACAEARGLLRADGPASMQALGLERLRLAKQTASAHGLRAFDAACDALQARQERGARTAISRTT